MGRGDHAVDQGQMRTLNNWRPRSRERLPDHLWHATVHRVRGEFEEMPCLRVSAPQAQVLFGLPDGVCEGVLRRLESDGFLGRTPSGEYVRHTTAP